MTPPASSPTPRPLIVRLRNWVGDVVLGIPALQLLASHGYDLELVGKGWAGSLMAGHGWPVHTRPASLRPRVAQLKALRQQAMARDPTFDRRENALVLPTSFSAALDMRLAGLKAVGYAQEARGWLLQRDEPIRYGGHALVSYWELACRFLRTEQPPPAQIGWRVAPSHERQAQALMHAHGLSPGFVVICPFAGGTFEKLDKTWPHFPAFTAALLKLAAEQGRTVVACPGPGEEKIVTGQHPGVTLLSQVDLGTYAALLGHAGLVVSNDTGPGHMAAAIGAPLLSVLGPTKPEQWAPWGPTVEVLRQWPEWPTVEQALDLTRRMLSSMPVRHAH
ncbi:MAG: glycosyltransferase family 9 protein [Pseudomonadota bacterium]